MKVLTWNLGFAALGAGASFWVDGGRPGLPSSRATIRANLDGIAATLVSEDADVVLLQEVSRGSRLTRGIDMLPALRAALPRHNMSFTSNTRLALGPFRRAMTHGLAAFSKAPHRATLRDTGVAASRLMGLFQKSNDPVLIDVEGCPVVFANLHLDPYGSDPGAKQRACHNVLAALQDPGGPPVVVGGDFNMTLAETIWPHQVPKYRTAWAAPLRDAHLPEGWTLAADAAVPSNRSLGGPYRPGQSHLTVIDGFAAQTGARLADVRTLDLGFTHADHNPVVATLAAPVSAPGPTP